MNKSESIVNLSAAQIKFQLEVQNPKNTNLINTNSYKFKYAPLSEVLNTVRPILAKHGLCLIQNVSTEIIEIQNSQTETECITKKNENDTKTEKTINKAIDIKAKVCVQSTLLHESGEFIEFDPLILICDKPTPQNIGSLISYARRYDYSAITSIASEDDIDATINNPTKVEIVEIPKRVKV